MPTERMKAAVGALYPYAPARPQALAEQIARARADNPLYRAPDRLSDLAPDDLRLALLDRDAAGREAHLAQYAEPDTIRGWYAPAWSIAVLIGVPLGALILFLTGAW